jgi:uncharacterized protein YjbJ (UPF0337 family)
MGLEDKLGNKIQDAGGKAKEAAGTAHGDEKLRQEGKKDQKKSSLKDAGENIKDAFKK